MQFNKDALGVSIWSKNMEQHCGSILCKLLKSVKEPIFLTLSALT